MPRDDVNKRPDTDLSIEELLERKRRSSELLGVAGWTTRQAGRRIRQELREAQQTRHDIAQMRETYGPEVWDKDSELQKTLRDADSKVNELVERRYTISESFYQQKEQAKVRAEGELRRGLASFTRERASSQRISSLSRGTEAFEGALRKVQKGAQYRELESMEAASQKDIRVISSAINEGLVSGDLTEDQLRELGRKLRTSETRAATAQRGMQYMRKIGQDPQSQMMFNQEVTARAMRRTMSSELREQTLKREEQGDISIKQVQEELKNVGASLANFQKQLNSGNITLEQYNEKVKESVKQYTDLEQQERTLTEAGRYGGGPVTRWLGRNRNRLMVGADIAQAVGGTTLGMANLAIDMQSVRAGYARVTNEQYDLTRKAAAGDQLAMMQVQRIAEAAGFGRAMFGMVRGGVGTQAAAQTIAGGVKAGLAYGTVGASTLVLGTGAGELSQAAVQSADFIQGRTAGQAELRAFQANMEKWREYNRIPARWRQTAWDTRIQLARGLLGAGPEMGQMYENFLSPQWAGQMIEWGLDPQDTAAQIGQMVRAQGADVATGGNIRRQFQTLVGARNRGMGDVTQNLPLMNQLVSAGTSSPDITLSRIMEDAITRGFDNSKGMEQLVRASTGIVQGTGLGNIGIDMTGMVASFLANLTGNRGTGLSTEAQVRAARETALTSRQLLQNQEVSLPNMLRMMRMYQAGVEEPIEQLAFMRTDIGELRGIQSGFRAPAGSQERQQAASLMMRRGLSRYVKRNQAGEWELTQPGLLDNVIRTQLKYHLEGVTGMGIAAAGPQAIEDLMSAYQTAAKRGIDLGTPEGEAQFLGMIRDKERTGEYRPGVERALTAYMNSPLGGSFESMGRLFMPREIDKSVIAKVTGTSSAMSSEQKQSIMRPPGYEENFADYLFRTGGMMTPEPTSNIVVKDFVRQARVKGEEYRKGIETGGGVRGVMYQEAELAMTLLKEGIDVWSTAAKDAGENLKTHMNVEGFKEFGNQVKNVTGGLIGLNEAVENLKATITNIKNPSTPQPSFTGPDVGYLRKSGKGGGKMY